MGVASIDVLLSEGFCDSANTKFRLSNKARNKKQQ